MNVASGGLGGERPSRLSVLQAHAFIPQIIITAATAMFTAQGLPWPCVSYPWQAPEKGGQIWVQMAGGPRFPRRCRQVLSNPAWMADARPGVCLGLSRALLGPGRPAVLGQPVLVLAGKTLVSGPSDKLIVGYRCSKRKLPAAWTSERMGQSPVELGPAQAAIKELIHKSKASLGAGWGLGR